MITDSNQVRLAKMTARKVQEVTHAMELKSSPLSDGEA
jgi:hypothetical protein